MSIKSSEVGAWLRQRAGGPDHRKVVRDDDTRLVIRPGPRFNELVRLVGEAGERSEPTATGDERGKERP